MECRAAAEARRIRLVRLVSGETAEQNRKRGDGMDDRCFVVRLVELGSLEELQRKFDAVGPGSCPVKALRMCIKICNLDASGGQKYANTGKGCHISHNRYK